MPHLTEQQREFAAALLDPELPTPPGLVGPDGEPSARRFGVYRNNVVAGLIETLKDAYPATCRIVGEEFFRAMARVYVASEPPSTPIMLDYGIGFPKFIGNFDQARILPYLSDVARIERAWTEAYHAQEAEPLDPAALMAIEPDQLPNIRLRLHPSVRTVRSPTPALTIWQMNTGDGVPAPVDVTAGGEDALIVRPIAEVEVRLMPAGGLEFVEALTEGLSVVEAMKAAMKADYRFDLSANLAGLISAGVFVGFDFDRAPSSPKSERRT